MTEEERDNGLESLFRSKLEENEMVAGSDLTGRLMSRLGRREFFRFNPLRFNVYYLTATLAGLTIAGVMLLSGPVEEAESVSPEPRAATVTQPGHDAGTSQPAATVKAEKAKTVLPSPEQIAGIAGTAGTKGTAVTAQTRGISAGNPVRRESAITAGNATGSTISVSSLEHRNQVAIPSQVKQLSIATSVSAGCVPLRVSFSCNAPEGAKLAWSFGDGGTSPLADADYIYDIPGRYRVMLTVIDKHGRTFTATTRIEVMDKPVAAFEVLNKGPLDESDRLIFVNMSSGAVNYLWDFGDGTLSTLSDPSYRYERMGTYDVSLLAYSADGCADSVTVSDIFTDMGMFIRFPNVFVPNTGGPTGGYYNLRSDEESQIFHPVASGIATYNLKIYSRAGMLVFESNEIGMGWDGWYKGGMCAPGVYVWKVRGTYRNGQTFIMAGDVTLLNY